MSVVTEPDAPATPAAEPAVARRLVVAWQHPTDRAIQPVGMLTCIDDEYEFFYVQNALTIDDFPGLLGFPDLRVRYRSASLFPLFAQRAMDPHRPDYQRYVHRLGLPADATPWEQIARSGGRRVGDTLQLLPVPTRRNDDLTCTFLVHGIRHIPERSLELGDRTVHVSRQDLDRTLEALEPGASLELLAEPGNPRNSNALLVTDASGSPFGYLPDLLVDDISQLRRLATIRLSVEVANPSSAPWHLRCLARLNAAHAGQYEFFAGERWQPIA